MGAPSALGGVWFKAVDWALSKPVPGFHHRILPLFSLQKEMPPELTFCLLVPSSILTGIQLQGGGGILQYQE
jgi:hypothetical protein